MVLENMRKFILKLLALDKHEGIGIGLVGMVKKEKTDFELIGVQ